MLILFEDVFVHVCVCVLLDYIYGVCFPWLFMGVCRGNIWIPRVVLCDTRRGWGGFGLYRSSYYVEYVRS